MYTLTLYMMIYRLSGELTIWSIFCSIFLALLLLLLLLLKYHFVKEVTCISIGEMQTW